jgi:type VI secretion system secreted protein Hcp
MATDYFLDIPSIPGESVDAKHPGQIVIDKFEFGVQSNCVVDSNGEGLQVSRSFMPGMSIELRASAASPKLFLACAKGSHIPQAVITGRKAGGNQQDYLTITLSDVLVTSYATAGSPSSGEGDDFIPREGIELLYGQIVVKYQQQDKNGPVGKAVRVGYSQTKAKAV